MDSLREVASPNKSSSLSVSIVGGGPSGLLLGILLHRVSAAQVTIYERNAPNDTFGFGVVFSDETLTNLRSADPQVFEQIEKEFVHWPTMDVVHRGRLLRSGGHGFAALSRKRLLNLLAARAIELGVKINYQTEVTSIKDLPASDLIVIGDGVNSSLRNQLADKFMPSIRRGEAKYIWFGTAKRFDQFTFLFAETQWGLFQAHVYPFSDTQATFIVETSPEVWRNAGLEKDATKDMKPGDVIDSIGGYTVRGYADIAKDSKRDNLVPIGIIAGAVVTKDIKVGDLITYDQVAVDESSLIVQLRRKQDEMGLTYAS